MFIPPSIESKDLDFRLGKPYKLCSKKSIESTFRTGLVVKSYPFFSKYTFCERKDVAFQVVLVVPKKKFKHATSRNRIRRYIREGIRLNKIILEDFMANSDQSINIYLAFHGDEFLNLETSSKAIEKLFNRIVKSMSND